MVRVLLVGVDAHDEPVVERLREAVEIVTVDSVQDALDAMLRERPSIVILNRVFDAVKPNDLARSLRGLVAEDIIVVHAGQLPDGSASQINAWVASPLRLAEVLEVLERVGRDGGHELKITTRMTRLRD